MLRSTFLAATAAVLALGSLTALADDDDDAPTVLRTETMAPVVRPYTGAANAIRGVNGGGVPWALTAGRVKLDAAGNLRVDVRGLIVPQIGNFNPAAFFRATVSCLSIDAGGNPVTRNIPTTNGAEVMIGDPKDGNARIRAQVELPKPCIAPIVFVTSANGSWFATTGL